MMPNIGGQGFGSTSASRFRGLQNMARSMGVGFSNQLDHARKEQSADNASTRRMDEATHRQGLVDQSWENRQTWRHPDQDSIDEREDLDAYKNLLRQSGEHWGGLIFDAEQDVRNSSAFGLASQDERNSMLQRTNDMAAELGRLHQEYSTPQAFQRWRSSEWSPDYSSITRIVQSVMADVPAQEGGGGDSGGDNNPPAPPPNEMDVSDEQIASVLGLDAGQHNEAEARMMRGLQSIQQYVRQHGTMPTGGIEAITSIARALGRAVPVPEGLSNQQRIMVETAIQRALNG